MRWKAKGRHGECERAKERRGRKGWWMVDGGFISLVGNGEDEDREIEREGKKKEYLPSHTHTHTNGFFEGNQEQRATWNKSA